MVTKNLENEKFRRTLRWICHFESDGRLRMLKVEDNAQVEARHFLNENRRLFNRLPGVKRLFKWLSKLDLEISKLVRTFFKGRLHKKNIRKSDREQVERAEVGKL